MKQNDTILTEVQTSFWQVLYAFAARFHDKGALEPSLMTFMQFFKSEHIKHVYFANFWFCSQQEINVYYFNGNRCRVKGLRNLEQSTQTKTKNGTQCLWHTVSLQPGFPSPVLTGSDAKLFIIFSSLSLLQLYDSGIHE